MGRLGNRNGDKRLYLDLEARFVLSLVLSHYVSLLLRALCSLSTSSLLIYLTFPSPNHSITQQHGTSTIRGDWTR